MNLTYEQFKNINLAEPFFDSLKSDYGEFSHWFEKKSEHSAYVFRDDSGNVDGFLYLKVEDGSVEDVTPPLPPARRVKVGTFKINAHGTKLGERFIKKIFDHALNERIDELYVTVFEKHNTLINLFNKYGFYQAATKTTSNGTELVLIKNLHRKATGGLESYPIVNIKGRSCYLLSLYPKWHTRLLPDSMLNTEASSIVKDVSHTNSIHKVYLAKMHGMENLKSGDVIIIYRTSDNAGPAYYRSVATSICVIEEYRNIRSFATQSEFIQYCNPYSVFTEAELKSFWKTKNYFHVIRFTYNFALPKRVTRGTLIERAGLSADAYWGFMSLTADQLTSIASLGCLDENLIIH